MSTSEVEQVTTEERVFLTPEEAIAMLPEGEYVHTFRNPGGMLLGADWKRASVEQAIREADQREIAGGMAASMGHGLVLFPKGAEYQSELLFVETRKSV